MAQQMQCGLSAPLVVQAHPTTSSSFGQLRVHGWRRGAPWPSIPGLECRNSRPEPRWRFQSNATGSSGSTAQFAKEMERVAAKEALLLAVNLTRSHPPLQFRRFRFRHYKNGRELNLVPGCCHFCRLRMSAESKLSATTQQVIPDGLT